MSWKEFKVFHPVLKVNVSGYLRPMGVGAWSYWTSETMAEEDKVHIVISKCTKDVSLDKEKWDIPFLRFIVDEIVKISEPRYPNGFEGVINKIEESKLVAINIYSIMETYICSAFNLTPDEVEELSPDEAFIKYAQACLIFPEKVLVDPNATRPEVPHTTNKEEWYCTRCKSEMCKKKEIHRKDWVKIQ